MNRNHLARAERYVDKAGQLLDGIEDDATRQALDYALAAVMAVMHEMVTGGTP